MGNRRDAIACVLCAGLACTRPPIPAPRPVFVGATKQYQPLEMTADGKLPGQAVILGTDDADRSVVLPLALPPRPAVIDATFATRDATKHAVGNAIAVTVVMAPVVPTAPSPSTPPGAPASPAGAPPGSAPGAPAAPSGPDASSAAIPPGAPGPGPAAPSAPGAPVSSTAWPAALWSAALVAATALGKDLPDVAFSAAPPVPSESAAASALIAAGLAATMTGEPIDPSATLVGMIEPDGAIGPVAGVPEQLLAAIARGKTRLGYPSGMRLARSLATGRSVDLVQLAKEHRAQAVELANVHDAYLLLTHKPLPAPVAAGEADMALDPEALERMGNRYLAWQQRLAGEWAPLLQLEQAGRIPPAVTQLVRLAHERSEQAEALYLAGKLARASRRMLAAWVYAAAANRTFAVLARLRAGDVSGAVTAFTSLDDPEADAAASFAKIGALRPTTLAGHLAVIAAFQAALRGWSYRSFAGDSLRTTTQLLTGLQDRAPREIGSPASADQIAAAVAPATVMMLRAIAELALADQELEPEVDHGIAHACSPQRVTALAEALRTAAAAGLRHAETLLVEPLARRAGVSEDAARRQVASSEPDFLVADQLSRWQAAELARELAASWGESSAAASLLAFAGDQLAHQSAARLLARHGLAVPLDDAGKPDRDAREALRSLVANAGRNARAAARAARIATGEIPVQAKLAYQLAAVDDTAGVAEQLDALAQLWMASAFSQAAVALARN